MAIEDKLKSLIKEYEKESEYAQNEVRSSINPSRDHYWIGVDAMCTDIIGKLQIILYEEK